MTPPATSASASATSRCSGSPMRSPRTRRCSSSTSATRRRRSRSRSSTSRAASPSAPPSCSATSCARHVRGRRVAAPAREAIDLEEMTDSLGELEKVLSPLSFMMAHKPVYRQVLVELYLRYVPRLVERERHGNEEIQQGRARGAEARRRPRPAAAARGAARREGARAAARRRLTCSVTSATRARPHRSSTWRARSRRRTRGTSARSRSPSIARSASTRSSPPAASAIRRSSTTCCRSWITPS